MTDPWQYQLRVYLPDDVAAIARADARTPMLQPLTDVLTRHNATLVSQLGAFEDYVAEAEREGPDGYPLYRWTKATIEDPAMRTKHGGTFAIRVAGEEVYAQSAADALEADLRPLAGGPLVARMTKHDTNPANNIPVPKQYQS